MSPRRLAMALAAPAALLLAAERLVERAPSNSTPGSSRPAAAAPSTSELKVLGDARLDAQVRRVVQSVDRDGRPPDGVVQGGRRGGRKGVFENAEGRLPARPRGYYAESDVWPRGPGGRGAERLVFGGAGEVYYSPDHYRTFVRLR